MPDIGSAISGVTGIAGAFSSSKSSSKAARAQQRAAEESAAVQREALEQNRYFYDTTRKDLSPWVNSGGDSRSTLDTMLYGLDEPGEAQGWNDYVHSYLPQFGEPTRFAEGDTPEGFGDFVAGKRGSSPEIASYLQGKYKDYQQEHAGKVDEYNNQDPTLLDNFTLADFTKEPGYQFRMDEGNKGIDRAAAARGGYDSGSTLKALSRFNQDYASNEYGKAYARDLQNKNRKFNYGYGVSNQGLGAASNVGQFGQQTAANNARAYGNLSDIGLQQGNIAGANAINQGNIRNSVLGNVGSLAQNYLDERKPVNSGYGNGNQLPGAYYRG